MGFKVAIFGVQAKNVKILIHNVFFKFKISKDDPKITSL